MSLTGNRVLTRTEALDATAHAEKMISTSRVYMIKDVFPLFVMSSPYCIDVLANSKVDGRTVL